MSSKLLKSIQKMGDHIQTTSCSPSQIYHGVTGDPCLACDIEVKLDVFFELQQESNMKLRIITYRGTEEGIAPLIIGRRVLEWLGFNNNEILMASREKYKYGIDVTERLVRHGTKEESERKIAALFGESFFHNDRNMEDEGLYMEDVYVDQGDNSMKDFESELLKRM